MRSEHRVRVFKDLPVYAWDWECTCGRRSIAWHVCWSHALGMAIHHLKQAAHDGEEERDGQQA